MIALLHLHHVLLHGLKKLGLQSQKLFKYWDWLRVLLIVVGGVVVGVVSSPSHLMRIGS